MAGDNYYFYDLETFGLDPKLPLIAQFAGIRTDANFNIIEEPTVLYCKISPEVVPSPVACAVTGILPSTTSNQGIKESDFAQRIFSVMSQQNTCVMGYNSLKFDDEFVRFLFYRNFLDPYQREYANGNSRWDLLPVVRAMWLLRPDGINWPQDKEGKVSLKLDKLAPSNNINHINAHDAKADVIATIELAKLLKAAQPRLFNYLFDLKDKHILRKICANQQPLLHISSTYGILNNYCGLILPLFTHPKLTNQFAVIKLSNLKDLDDLFNADIQDLLEYLKFDPNHKSPLYWIKLNQCPVVVPVRSLSSQRYAELDIDVDKQTKISKSILQNKDFMQRIQTAISTYKLDYTASTNVVPTPESQLYSGGFMSFTDKKVASEVPHSPAIKLSDLQSRFSEQRFRDLMLHYRARNFPDSLSEAEQEYWRGHCDTVIKSQESMFIKELEQVKNEMPNNSRLLPELNDYLEYFLETPATKLK